MSARTFSRAELRAQREYADACEAANEEGALAQVGADKLCALLDRHAGDWGDDPDWCGELVIEINGLIRRVEARLGKPRRGVYRDGVLVALVKGNTQ